MIGCDVASGTPGGDEMMTIAQWGILLRFMLWVRLNRICIAMGWLDGAYHALRKARRLQQIFRDGTDT
jgi:hypothetical protein